MWPTSTELRGTRSLSDLGPMNCRNSREDFKVEIIAGETTAVSSLGQEESIGPGSRPRTPEVCGGHRRTARLEIRPLCPGVREPAVPGQERRQGAHGRRHRRAMEMPNDCSRRASSSRRRSRLGRPGSGLAPAADGGREEGRLGARTPCRCSPSSTRTARYPRASIASSRGSSAPECHRPWVHDPGDPGQRRAVRRRCGPGVPGGIAGRQGVPPDRGLTGRAATKPGIAHARHRPRSASGTATSLNHRGGGTGTQRGERAGCPGRGRGPTAAGPSDPGRPTPARDRPAGHNLPPSLPALPATRPPARPR